MSQRWPTHDEDSSKFPRHPSVASLGTNASGVAESAISLSTLATCDTPRLSQFPLPPPSVAVTPVQSDFIAPFRDQYRENPTASINPNGTRTASHMPPSISISPLVPVRNLSAPTTKISRESVSTVSSRRTIMGPREQPSLRKADPQVLPQSITSPTAPGPCEQQYPLMSSASSRSLFLESGSASPHSSTSPASLSPYDWHEGSSSIVVDPAEERLLSTSFITGLLSSENFIDENGLPVYSGDGLRNDRDQRSEGDGTSAISEMTYPPSSRFMVTPSPEYYSPPQRYTVAPLRTRQDTIPQAPVQRPPPSAFVPIDTGGRSTSQSYHSADSDTLHSALDTNTSSVIRTASFSRKLSARGASVVGIAPAMLHKVSAVSSNRVSSNQGADECEQRDSGATAGAYYAGEGDKAGLTDFAGHSSMLYSPALPSTAGARTGFPSRRSLLSQRQSLHSTKSTKSYVSSLISKITNATSVPRSARRAFTWLRKPLPPVPTLPNVPIAAEREHRRVEDNLPLPELVNRAGTLSQMLEKGYHPHQSYNSLSFYGAQGEAKANVVDASTTTMEISDGTGQRGSSTRNSLWKCSRGRKTRQGVKSQDALPSPEGSNKKRCTHKKLYLCAITLSILIIIGVSVGITQSHKHHNPICVGNLTGAACDLDATCVCTSSSPGQCLELAQNLVSLTPTLNTLFNTNYTPNSIATAIWQIQGGTFIGSCASQSLLVDVGPSLDTKLSPNRTTWAQTALLWNLVQSLDVNTVGQMQKFVINAPWKDLPSIDGPATSSTPDFSITASGYVFDFAAQTITQPAIKFASNGQPSAAQIAQVGEAASSALDRLYTFALASSTQRQLALALYWRTVLQQQPTDLSVFLSAVSASDILLPFDATSSPSSQPIASLMSNSSAVPFPPPLACYPGLSSAQLQQVNAIETSIFGLSSAPPASQFDPACYPDRPIYGVLDILRLRLPFMDSQTGLAKQAAVLKRDVSPRAVVYTGAALSTLPNSLDASNLTSIQNDPRQYGTMSHLNHVLLNYLSSIPDVNAAISLVKFVLSSPVAPPENGTALFGALDSIPPLEVAIFGTVDPSDVDSAVSSFSTPSGSLFFGSDQAANLRAWAISGAGSSIAWTEFASSPEIVRDTSLSDNSFNQVWTPASTFLHSAQPGVKVDVSNITNAFLLLGKFSPS